MNNTNTTTIESINQAMFYLAIPSLILISTLMCIGIVGNTATLYIYGFRLKKLPVYIFFISLSIFDMIACLFAIPIEMVGVIYPVMYPSTILCKLEKFLVLFSSVSSTQTLLVIAVERYNKICRHTKPQLTVSQAKVIIIVIVCFSIPISLPGGLFFDKATIPITSILEGQICGYTLGYEKIFEIYFLIYLIINFSILIILFVLHYIIWKYAKEHADYMATMESFKKNNENSYKKVRQTNKILIYITVLYAISFIPSLIIVVTNPLLDGIQLSEFVFSLREIGFRMWYFNGAINPLVYGLMNNRSRQILLNCLLNKK
ncbi:hypothetical protein Ahia01_000114600 [Argonauta hians]